MANHSARTRKQAKKRARSLYERKFHEKRSLEKRSLEKRSHGKNEQMQARASRRPCLAAVLGVYLLGVCSPCFYLLDFYLYLLGVLLLLEQQISRREVSWGMENSKG